MKQNKQHRGRIAYVNELQRALNKFKQGRDGINTPIYFAPDFSNVLKEFNSIGVGYVNKQHNTDQPPTQDQVLTQDEMELVEDKDKYEQVLIIGNYDRSK